MAKDGWTDNFPFESELDSLNYNDYGSELKSCTLLTDRIENFIGRLYQGIQHDDISEIDTAYTVMYPALNADLFSAQRWPHYTIIAPLVDHDKFFLCIYQDLYFRHLHSKFQSHLTVEDYVDAFNNYDRLFNMILQRDDPIDVMLPVQLIWDIIDEFLYQFQAFNAYRARLKSRTPAEIESLKQDSVWSVHAVLNILHQLVSKSNINEQLDVYNRGGDPNEVTDEFGKNTLYKMFGLYALVGLCRLHCQFGDYYLALKVLEKLNLSQLDIYLDVPSCHITTGYHVGFSYMMMRRYENAIGILSHTLGFFNRNHPSIRLRCSSSESYEYMTKMTEQMFTLLAMCYALHPTKMEDTVFQVLRTKYNDRLGKLQKMDMDEYEISFSFAAPRFLSLTLPDFDDPDTNQVVVQGTNQCRIFKAEVEDQMTVPYLRSFLKLYTTISIQKLAEFMKESEADVLHKLMCYKHKLQKMSCIITDDASTNPIITPGQSGFIDFYIDGNIIHVSDAKPDPKYAEFFTRQIEDVNTVDKKLTALHQKVKEVLTASQESDGYTRQQHFGGSYASVLTRR